jgi:hypothetical protein
VAVVRADGVVLKAQHLQDAQQIEGIVHWVPDTVWYDSFDRGPWWFSSSEWEYVFEPNRGEMYFGVWRGERLSGDGIVGRIRFRAAATLLGLRVWVDGQPVEATFEDRRSEHDDGVLTLVPGDGATRGVQGTRTNHAWFILPAPVSEK